MRSGSPPAEGPFASGKGGRFESGISSPPTSVSPEDVRNRARDESMAFAIDEGHVAHRRNRMDAIWIRAVPKRSDGLDGLLLEFGRREAHDAVHGDSPAVRLRAVLRGTVQHALVEEGSARGPRRTNVRLDRIRRVRFPRSLEARRMPHE